MNTWVLETACFVVAFRHPPRSTLLPPSALFRSCTPWRHKNHLQLDLHPFGPVFMDIWRKGRRTNCRLDPKMRSLSLGQTVRPKWHILAKNGSLLMQLNVFGYFFQFPILCNLHMRLWTKASNSISYIGTEIWTMNK